MYGKTLVEHMDAIGFLGPRVCFAHGIWLTPRDIEIVRDRDVSIAHNPVSNMKLGSGIAAVPTLLAEGVNVALGTDGMSSNDGLDMFASLKQAALLHKLWGIDYERWTGAVEAWRLATIGGARPAGDGQGLGRLEPGRRAGVVALDLGPVFNTLNALGASSLSARRRLRRPVLVARLRCDRPVHNLDSGCARRGAELGREIMAARRGVRARHSSLPPALRLL